MIYLILILHLFTPLTEQNEKNHRIWIKEAKHEEDVTFKFWFKEKNYLVFIQQGKEIKKVKFKKNETKYFTFQEWDRNPLVRFCEDKGKLIMWFLNRKSYDYFKCQGKEIKPII